MSDSLFYFLVVIAIGGCLTEVAVFVRQQRRRRARQRAAQKSVLAEINAGRWIVPGDDPAKFLDD
jgi:hypothetical protein